MSQSLGSLVTYFDGDTHGVERGAKRAGGAISRFARGSARALFSLQTAFIALAGTAGIGLLTKSILESASAVEQLEASLDVITKGKGSSVFQELDQWAAKMPVNTEKAIAMYQKMSAMGLRPMLDELTTIVDAMSATGGGAVALQGIGRALGQMKSLGKVSAEELNQLAEQGIPALTILKEKLNLTAKDMRNLSKAGVTTNEAIKALFEGMKERFGGASARFMTTWAGKMELAADIWTRFKRSFAASGPFYVAKAAVSDLLTWLEKLQKQGDLQLWAYEMAQGFLSAVGTMISGIGQMGLALNAVLGTMMEIQQRWREFRIGQLEKGMSKMVARRKELQAEQGGPMDLIQGALGYATASDQLVKVQARYEAITGQIVALNEEHETEEKLLNDLALAYATGDSALKGLMDRLEEYVNESKSLQVGPFQTVGGVIFGDALGGGGAVDAMANTNEEEKEEKTLLDTSTWEAIPALTDQFETFLMTSETLFDGLQNIELGFQEESKTAWQEWAESVQGSWEGVGATLINVFDSAIQGFSSSVAQALVYGANFAEAMQRAFKALAANIVTNLATMAIRHLAATLIMGKASSVLFGVQAAQEVALAGMRATASFAYLGPGAAVIGSATSAASQAQGLAAFAGAQGLFGGLAGMEHGGLDFVPEEASYVLEQGERVLSPEQNEDFTDMLDGGGSTGGGQVVQLVLNGSVLGEALVDLVRNGEAVSGPHTLALA